MGFEIITDSSANLPNSIIDQYNIHVLSLVYRFGDDEYESYIKGADNNLEEFYARLRNKEVAITACVSPGVCHSVAEDLLEQGKEILYIGFSSALSATYVTCMGVLESLKNEYPDQKIYAVDSLAASLGQGLLVTYAARMRKEGKSIDEVYNWLLNNRLNLCHWFTVDDLMFLKRGGRVPATTAIVGTMLSIKPIMHVDNEGRLVPVSKVRGRRNSLLALVDQMEKAAINPEEQIIYISHGDCIADANFVADKIKEKWGVKDILIDYVEPVIGAHSGPGTVALFFLGKER